MEQQIMTNSGCNLAFKNYEKQSQPTKTLLQLLLQQRTKKQYQLWRK